MEDELFGDGRLRTYIRVIVVACLLRVYLIKKLELNENYRVKLGFEFWKIGYGTWIMNSVVWWKLEWNQVSDNQTLLFGKQLWNRMKFVLIFKISYTIIRYGLTFIIIIIINYY